jgi:hypothetical protein
VPHKKLTQKKFVKRDIPKPKSRIQARRFPVRAKKKIVVQKEKVKDRFEQDKEEIDINDPDIQDEIMRALAGDEDLDPSEELDEDEEMPEDDYAGDEDPMMHGANDDDY